MQPAPTTPPRLTAIPAKRSPIDTLKLRVRLVMGGLLTASALGAVSTVAWVANAPQPADLSTLNAKGTAVATAVAQDYLAGRPLAVPVVEGVDSRVLNGSGTALPHDSVMWDGFERRQLPGDDQAAGVSYELHRFLVRLPAPTPEAPKAGRIVQLTVTVVLDPTGPVLGAAPALGPAPVGTSAPVFDYSDLDQAEVSNSSAIEQKIQDWSAAYATGDSKALYTITGDTQDRSYTGVGGFEIQDPTRVLSVVPVDEDTVVARVCLFWTSANGFATSSEFDLLIDRADTEGPVVTAWGAAGTGTELVAYENGIPN